MEFYQMTLLKKTEFPPKRKLIHSLWCHCIILHIGQYQRGSGGLLFHNLTFSLINYTFIHICSIENRRANFPKFRLIQSITRNTHQHVRPVRKCEETSQISQWLSQQTVVFQSEVSVPLWAWIKKGENGNEALPEVFRRETDLTGKESNGGVEVC